MVGSNLLHVIQMYVEKIPKAARKENLFTQKALSQSTAGCYSFHVAYITLTVGMAQPPVQVAKNKIEFDAVFKMWERWFGN